jgi:LuxR family maltose regulon positive regulatory protein
MTTHERGDLAAAERHFSAVIANAERLHFACVREAFCRQVLIFETQGKMVESDLALTRLRELIVAIGAPEHLAICDSLAARVALFRGDIQTARQWLFTVRPDSTRVELLHIENPLMTRVMVLIAQGTDASLPEAATVLDELRRHATAAHVLLPLIDIEALTALHREAAGDQSGATAALRASLAHSAKAQAATRYSFLPLALEPILRRLLTEDAPPPNTQTVLAIVESASRARHRLGQSAMPAPESGALTSREHETLRCLARRLTNDEIGAELFISTNTARNHVAHICEKLGVAGRRLAVVRARELGLIA